MTVKLHYAWLTVLMAALLAPAASFAQSGDNDGCSNATLTGDYAFRLSGENLIPGGPPVLGDGVSMTHFDGDGHLKQVGFVMVNGVPAPGPTDPITGFHTGETGTYVVFPDCTGKAEIRTPVGAVIDLMFVLSNHGHTVHMIVSRAVPPGFSQPVPSSIHNDGEKLGD